MAPYPLAIGQGVIPQSSASPLPSASMVAVSPSLTLTDPTPTVRHMHELPARSFHHLGIFAYIAFGFIILAVTTVLAYIIYSCYHTARGRMDTTLVPNFTPSPIRNDSRAEAGDRDVFGDEDGGKVHAVLQPRGMSGGIGAMARMGDRVVEAGEKVRRTSAKFGQTIVLEMKELGHAGIKSESLRDISASHPKNSNSQITLSDAGTDASYGSESDAYYLTSPPMAHTFSERSAAYVLPFHLPPPPPSPTPAHKQHVERHYGKQQSPISPSPSFCTIACSPPPITPRLKSPGVGGKNVNWSGQTVIGSAQSNIGKENSNSAARGNGLNGSDDSPKGTAAGVQFDSNNIRFVSPLNPFNRSVAASLWSDPKLSPVNGSIIASATPMTPTPDAPFNEESSFATTLTSALMTPPSSKLKRFGSPNQLDSNCKSYGNKENGSPFRGRKDTLRPMDRSNIMGFSEKPNSNRA